MNNLVADLSLLEVSTLEKDCLDWNPGYSDSQQPWEHGAFCAYKMKMIIAPIQ
jgi:hypothetical protein